MARVFLRLAAKTTAPYASTHSGRLSPLRRHFVDCRGATRCKRRRRKHIQCRVARSRSALVRSQLPTSRCGPVQRTLTSARCLHLTVRGPQKSKAAAGRPFNEISKTP